MKRFFLLYLVAALFAAPYMRNRVGLRSTGVPR